LLIDSLIVNADKIVVMDKGLIVEQGTHKELINEKWLLQEFV
jgi:ABC-type multidrug transport system fused ATPase/permease subunit